MLKKIMSFAIATAMVVTMCGCGSKNQPVVREINRTIGENDVVGETEIIEENIGNQVDEVSKGYETEIIPADETELLSGIYAVLIEVENYGDIFVELDADSAPITVTNFMKLVNEDYYSGLTFHRIIKGFMMQGGLSKENPAAKIKGEFELNGISNPIKHERGTISMARANDPDSASAQFFICQEDNSSLDGVYAAFGHVVSGIEVVDKICNEAVVIDGNGSVAAENQPVIKGIYDVTAEYRHDALGEGGFEPANNFEAELGRDTFESYDEIISLLTSGMGYAYVEIDGADEPILLISSCVFDNQD